ncbi:MAG: pyrroline-5-carboxylate reductase [Lachnospiraceae bacterium]|nr:pyrroline-5-carboxylate reductase [Lachnospiraceae bacterium]
MKLGFIGAGNMATAIFSGMIRQGLCRGEEIMVSRRQQDALEKLQAEYGVRTTTDNRQVAEWAEVLFLAVKPQMLTGVIEEIRSMIKAKQLVISVAAGKTLSWLEGEFQAPVKLIRSMPNTPAMVGEGCTAFCGNSLITKEDEALTEKIFNCCGSAYQVPENLMDAVGAVSGSSPAYVFMFMEAMADAAVAGGMPRALAYRMAGQAVLGSAKLMLETGEHPGVLKDMVCSPAGTTICGVKVLEEKGMKAAVFGALEACIERSKKI